jgi:hypothetical protein
LRRRLFALLGVSAIAAAGFGMAHPLTAQAATSTQVAYVTDASNGGFSLWVDGLGVTAPAEGATYTTHAPSTVMTVTIHNVGLSTLDVANSTALNTMDTVVVFSMCDIANHPNAMKAISSFFEGGGKLLIMDGGQCVDGNGGQADYSGLSKPFIPNYKIPLPQYLSAPYSFTESSTLTTGLPDCTPAPCNEPGNAVGDASMLSPTSVGWCKALGGTSSNGVKGAVEAYTRNTKGTGLAVYSGEPFAYSTASPAQQKHGRIVFDNMLAQPWNTDGLTCTAGMKSVNLSPTQDSKFTGVNEVVSAKVLNSAGTAVSGLVVTFTVISGPNLNTTGPGTTDATGVATFTYTSSKAGTDVVKASFSDTEDHVSNTSSVVWTLAPPPSIPETHSAILVPVIGLALMGGAMLLPLARRRRRSAKQTQ